MGKGVGRPNRIQSQMVKPIHIIALAMLLVISACGNEDDKDSDSKKNEETQVPKDTTPPKPPTIEYEFVLDSFKVVIDTVQEGQTMSHIMLPHGLDQVQINEAYVNAKDSLIGLNFITVGHRYTVLYNPSDTSKAKHLIYEKNITDYVVFTFNEDEVVIEKRQKPIDVRKNEAAGVITSSLWNAFVDQGLTPELVMKVVQTYQWSVDFFSIQKGDYYKIIYDERSVDGKAISSGDIHALVLNTYDSSYYAIPFEAGDSVHGFFDGQGGSLRKALLKAPLDYIRISSGFSYNRLHPVLGYRRPHLGVDYAAPSGTPVVSVGDGTVIFAGWGGGGGNTIKIQHNGNIKTYYLHLRKMLVRAGDHVVQGQQIGEVGSTGISTGPHLDYRLEINGKKVDPVHADIPTSEPLPEALLEEFMIKRDSLVKQLEMIPVPEAGEDHHTAYRDSIEQTISE